MTVFLALIAATGIVLTIRAMVIVHQATAVMEDVAAKAREVSNLAFAIKAQNDAMLAAQGYGGGGGNSPDSGKMVKVKLGHVTEDFVRVRAVGGGPAGSWSADEIVRNNGHKAVTEGYLGGGDDPRNSGGRSGDIHKVNAGN